jgi:hypothetical protein
LVFFARPEDKSGKPKFGGDCDGSRLEAIYVCDPQLEQPPQLLWRENKHGPLLRPIARPARNLAVMQDTQAWIIEFDKGRATPLLESTRATNVIDVVDGRIYFADQQLPSDFGGYGMGDGSDGRTVVKSYRRPQDHLFVRDAIPTAKARRLGDCEIERLLITEPDGFWVVTAGSNRKLARIDREGGMHELLDFDPHWVAPETYLSFSLDHRFVAVALLHDQHDFFDERELLVIDIARRQVVLTRERISVGTHRGDTKLSEVEQDEVPAVPALPRAFDNAVHQLHVRWLDCKTLEFGGFGCDGTVIDVESGMPVDAARATELRGPLSAVWPWEVRETIGSFEMKCGSLYYRGENEPVASRSVNGELELREMSNLVIDPDGVWAAYTSSVDGTYLVDGERKQERLLLPGWSYGVEWLAAAPE